MTAAPCDATGSPPPAVVLDALGDPTRRAIVEILSAGPSSVRAIADQLPVSRPAVSRHLRLLKTAALVVPEPVGAQRVYRLRHEGVVAVRSYFEQLWGEVAARFTLAAESLPAENLPAERPNCAIGPERD